jgi:hypothetical protein
MTIELLYTSAAQGLKQGSRGFCTVVCTTGLPINLAQRLESLSGYRHLYQPGDPRADENPICHSHIRLTVGGKALSILSRVGAYGVDYSQRTNKIAHHVVFDGPVPSCGPAAVLLQPSVMRTNWDGECKTLPTGPNVPPITLQPAPCGEWQRITGDAGWAGVVANAWMQPTGKPVWIVFSELHSASLLELMQEAIAILPESRRWQATFSTYCTNLPPDVECRVRCVIAGSDEARMSIARGTVLDLTKPLGVATESSAADAARGGYTIGSKTSPVQSVSESPHQADETSEDIESALATHSADKNEYRLTPQLSSLQPIPLVPPTRRSTKYLKRNLPQSQIGLSKQRKVLVVLAIAMTFLSIVGSGLFYFAINPLALVVSDPPKEKSNEVDEVMASNNVETTDQPTSNAALVTSPQEAETKGMTASIPNKPEVMNIETQVPAKPLTRKIILSKDGHPISSFAFLESARIVDEHFLADIVIAELPNPDWAKIEFRSEEQTLLNGFIARDGKLLLKSKELPQLKSKKYTISLNYKDGDIHSESLEFSIVFTNVDDPNIELLIADSKQSESNSNFQVGDFAAGTILNASVTREDRDENPGHRTWSWFRRRSGSNDGWQRINGKTKQSYDVRLEADTGKELQSRLVYGSNNPESEAIGWKTEVVSQAVQILKPSTLTILVPQLGVKSINDLDVSVTFRTPQFSNRSIDQNSGKKIVYNYMPPKGGKLLINSRADTSLLLKSLVPEGEIAKLAKTAKPFLNAIDVFESAIDKFKTNLKIAKSRSEGNPEKKPIEKHLLTIQKLLFKDDHQDQMDILLGYLANHEKAAQLIDDTLKLDDLMNLKIDKMSDEQKSQLTQLENRYINEDHGYPKFNNRSFLKERLPDERRLCVITFKWFWDFQIPEKDAELLDKANLKTFLANSQSRTPLSDLWNQINTANFFNQRDQFTQFQFDASANGKIISTEIRSEEMGPNTKPFLEFPIWLDFKIKLRPELFGNKASGSSAVTGTPRGTISDKSGLPK